MMCKLRRGKCTLGGRRLSRVHSPTPSPLFFFPHTHLCLRVCLLMCLCAVRAVCVSEED